MTLTENNTTPTLNLSLKAFSSIIEMAGYGIGYWASTMSRVPSDIPWEGLEDAGFFYCKACRFTEAESGDEFLITREMMEKAALDLYVKSPLNNYYMSAIRSLVTTGCAGEVGSDIADALVQQACFGEVVYG